MSLMQVQQGFDALLQGREGSLVEDICDNLPLSPTIAVQVYRQNTIGALESALKACYSVCVEIVGENYFTQCAQSYIERFPLVSNDLNCYGKNFPEYIGQFITERGELSGLNYLKGLCQLERLLHEAYYAKPKRQFDAQHFSMLDDQSLNKSRLLLAEDVSFFHSSFNVDKLWRFHQGDKRDNIELESGEFFFLVHRKNLKPEIVAIDVSTYRCLKDIRHGMNFLALCEQHAILKGKASQPPPIGEYIAAGWIDGFVVS